MKVLEENMEECFCDLGLKEAVPCKIQEGNIIFHLKVRSYGICLSPPGLFHLA